MTRATSNYSFSAAATLTGNITANTLRYTGGNATLANAGKSITLNGLMNAGSASTLTVAGTGNLMVGANRELVILANAQNTVVSAKIADSSAGASSLTYSGDGTLTLSGTNTYSGGTTVASGTLAVVSGTLGSGDVTVNGGVLSLSGAGNMIGDGQTLTIANGAKVVLSNGVSETVYALVLGDTLAYRGFWGASGSGAANIDDIHFSGTGIVYAMWGRFSWLSRGTAIYIGLPSSASWPTPLITNALPFAESFESYSPAKGIADISGWMSAEGDASRILSTNYAYMTTRLPLDTSHTNVLYLETEGQTLGVFLGTNGSAQASHTWVDMMTCLISCEDSPTCENAMAAVFADYHSNLIFYAASLSPDGQRTAAYFNLTPGRTVTYPDWHRLTFDIVSAPGLSNDFIRVFLDGQVLTNAAARVTPTGAETNGTWFCLARHESNPVPSLAFQGDGLVDDLCVTANRTPLSFPCTVLTTVGSNGCADVVSPLVVPSGISTQIVYTANDWYRIRALFTDGIDRGIGGPKVYTQTIQSVVADISNSVSFALLPDSQNGQGGRVPSDWLAARVPESFVPDSDGFGTEEEWLLGMNPTVSNTVVFEIQDIAVRAAETEVGVRLTTDGERISTEAAGVLTLWACDALENTWSNVWEKSIGSPSE